jgi:frataxin
LLQDGVLTVQLGSPHGTYVINRQRPNLQLWLSSPQSGPKRYDFVNGLWLYKHDGMPLHRLLEQELSKIMSKPIDLSKCAYASPDH